MKAKKTKYPKIPKFSEVVGVEEPIPVVPEVAERSYPKKATFVEVEARLEEVIKLASEGYDRPTIIQYGMKKWGINEGAVDKYLKRAWDRLKEANRQSIEETAAFIVRGFVTIYRRAMAKDRFSEASNALSSLAKIKGLEQHNINLTVERVDKQIEQLSPDELTHYLREDNEK